MLITRLSVTLQSFIWAGRGKEKKDEVLALSNNRVNSEKRAYSRNVPETLFLG